MFYGDYPFHPDKLEETLSTTADYWEHIAEQAVKFFSDKADYMDWVCRNYATSEARFAADVCWDVVRLGES